MLYIHCGTGDQELGRSILLDHTHTLRAWAINTYLGESPGFPPTSTGEGAINYSREAGPRRAQAAPPDPFGGRGGEETIQGGPDFSGPPWGPFGAPLGPPFGGETGNQRGTTQTTRHGVGAPKHQAGGPSTMAERQAPFGAPWAAPRPLWGRGQGDETGGPFGAPWAPPFGGGITGDLRSPPSTRQGALRAHGCPPSPRGGGRHQAGEIADLPQHQTWGDLRSPAPEGRSTISPGCPPSGGAGYTRQGGPEGPQHQTGRDL